MITPRHPTPTILGEVEKYYSEKITAFGAVPLGVDWNNQESQEKRFAQLLKIVSPEIADFSINDLGCGYGHLLSYISGRYPGVTYVGIDISEAMISHAKRLHSYHPSAEFLVGDRPPRPSDYTLASGIFNVRLANSSEAWNSHILETITLMNLYSNRGFCFNCLTKYSDRALMKRHLHYADPCHLFDYCKQHFSANVALLHDYGLYEFTILVRKTI